MSHTPPLSRLFLFFSQDKYSTNLTINDKNVEGVLGTQTQGGRMVGIDESTDLRLVVLLNNLLQISVRRVFVLVGRGSTSNSTKA